MCVIYAQCLKRTEKVLHKKIAKKWIKVISEIQQNEKKKTKKEAMTIELCPHNS